MDYIKEYKSFINSYYLTEGVRITAGVALPAIVLSYFDLLSAGIVVSLGALCASITDNPGPIQHRRNGMLACLSIIFMVSLLTGFAAPYPVMLGMLILVLCFVFSMIGIYGSRANSIGVAALIVMVLNIDRQHQGWDVVLNAAYVCAGGVWYMLLSLLLYSIRPYKLAQQALGDCILATSDYLRVRASFYDKQVNYENTYRQMLEQQIAVHEKQNLVRELLFRSRNIVKESTNTGRTLLMIFLDIVDLFERAMTSYQDYEALHNYFNDTDILQRFQQLIMELSKELDDIGIAVKSGRTSAETNSLRLHLKEIQEYFDDLRDKKRTTENIESFISLRHILNSIQDIAERIYTLHQYTAYDKKISKKFLSNLEYAKFITHQDTDPRLLKDNLTLKSNTFRHALRVSIATIAGYVISKFFPFGHSYWILLTIIVILKPAYSLTKKRNYERLLGTIAGALIGLLILYLIKDNTVLFVIMLFFMIGTYSFLRTNYMIAVLMMTPYILLLLHLLNSGNFQTIIADRVIDTGIGSMIAFFANFLLVPAWEHEQIKNYMAQSLEDSTNYFTDISNAFVGKPFNITQYKLSRKNAFVSLANLSDAFTRMLSEPKWKQKNSKLIHQFVVLNHMLVSHIATLSYYVKPLANKYKSDDFIPITNHTIAQLKDAKAIINGEEINEETNPSTKGHVLDKRVNELLQKRHEEIQDGFTDTETRKTLSEFKSIVDQFNFIVKITSDIKKMCIQMEEEEE
jgi:YccS/YhfK family integral membrane protein